MPTKPPTKPEPPVDRGAGHKPGAGWGTAADLKELWVYVEGNPIENIRERIVNPESCKIKLTIDGAHTVTIPLNDWDRKILRGKNIIRHKSQIFIQNRWWTLVQGGKSGDTLTLTFEDAHVANLRKYGKVLKVPKSWGSRCQFVWRLVLEAAATDRSLNYEAPCAGQNIPNKLVDAVLGLQEPKSPFIRSPFTSAQPKGKTKLFIRGVPPDSAQLDNINIIMDVCQNMNVRRKVAVCVMMIGIHESNIRNLGPFLSPLNPFTGNHVQGVWQQDPAYWPASGNVRTDAIGDGKHIGTVTHCNQLDKQYPNISMNDLANRTQDVSKYDFFGQAGEFRIEAERIVTAWGWSGGDIREQVPSPSDPNEKGGDNPPIVVPPGFNPVTSGGGTDIQWHRGAPLAKKGKRHWQKENSWACMQRMANEVNWYNFMLGDYVVFAPGSWLFAKDSGYTFREFDPGIDMIDFDYDVNKMNATVTIHTRIEEWPVDPGNVISLADMGIVDGQWLVSAYERSLFSHEVTVTAVKPKPALPEPKASDNTFHPGTGGEITPPKKGPPFKKNIRDAIVAWAESGAKGPPPFYGKYNGGYRGKAGDWPEKMDCSDFVSQCYAWGSELDEQYDPNANNWNDGDTSTLFRHGQTIPQSKALRGDLVIWAGGSGAVGGDREHTAVFVEDWKGDDTKMVSHGGSQPGPSYVNFKDENDWQIIHHGAKPTFKNYLGDMP